MIQHIAAGLQKSINRYRSLDYAVYHKIGSKHSLRRCPANSSHKRHEKTSYRALLPMATNLTDPGKMLYVETNRTLIMSGGGTGPMKPATCFDSFGHAPRSLGKVPSPAARIGEALAER